MLTIDPPKKFPVLGFPVDCLPEYQPWLANRIAEGQSTHVVTLNAEMTMLAQETPQLADVIRAAEFVIPDGAGVVLYLKLFGEQIQRCPGIELAAQMLEEAAQSSWSVFFFGGEPSVASEAAEKWQQKLPNLQILGTQNGFLTPEDTEPFLHKLQELQPQLIFVGLGVPRQEYWIAQHRHLCPNAVWMGIGGSFDIWAERSQRAPAWLCNNNLEWVYRLYQEPWRWRRMLALPRFAWRSLLVKLR
ncbi:N-acetylglucosaminyldiphosphoundecaprenol N-acetyl-beta-D-mannosaminyltransferase [Acaryochloris thomasi RCC1774]|uniref:N-acetylglucosaminyldiphosphoundecaprenol N-acetyl-beta-D-mannosaminyltransferase n=1 Tax=Acaryochloris thomasi RCC1774 TaxID=1764569 RepID=A0A2W1K4I4_9CYAN|nr:WecB/TagA/CpsF family glycosyltransferase [Acaryochloris thomasi]PZD74727.1 N-acetylglucosaminyldiphosphoundecaprenol N-acetyl-beta-D-mannosaminyltransferase [Acaryochloris thomasi RCC1774]